MKLHELKTLLAENKSKAFHLSLPDLSTVPVSFHITEVGLVHKTFIDCGGKVHRVRTCQLQVWVGEDLDHRLETAKIERILELSASIVPDESLEVEFEYEHALISQYPVQAVRVADDSVTLFLRTKHTDCLAKEICLTPESGSASGCCGSATKCC
jgi:hypothetical protein